jgi:hypothetical protein
LIEDSKQNDDDIWEALQLLNGDIFIYRGGFKEEAFMKDVFRLSEKSSQFSRFYINAAPPVKDSMVRLNRAVIAFAWYADPDSSLVQELKKL